MADARHLLLVEDDNAQAKLLLMHLLGSGCELHVDRVADGEAALEYLFQQGRFADRPRPDLILLDLNLPRISGHEVLRRVKSDRELRQVPVVMLTTSSSRTDIVAAYENGVNSYLVKPLDFDQFRSLVRDLSAYWCGWNEATACAANDAA